MRKLVYGIPDDWVCEDCNNENDTNSLNMNISTRNLGFYVNDEEDKANEVIDEDNLREGEGNEVGNKEDLEEDQHDEVVVAQDLILAIVHHGVTGKGS